MMGGLIVLSVETLGLLCLGLAAQRYCRLLPDRGVLRRAVRRLAGWGLLLLSAGLAGQGYGGGAGMVLWTLGLTAGGMVVMAVFSVLCERKAGRRSTRRPVL